MYQFKLKSMILVDQAASVGATTNSINGIYSFFEKSNVLFRKLIGNGLIISKNINHFGTARLSNHHCLFIITTDGESGNVVKLLGKHSLCKCCV